MKPIKPDIGQSWPKCLDCGKPLALAHPFLPQPTRCEACAKNHEVQVNAVNRAFARR